MAKMEGSSAIAMKIMVQDELYREQRVHSGSRRRSSITVMEAVPGKQEANKKIKIFCLSIERKVLDTLFFEDKNENVPKVEEGKKEKESSEYKKGELNLANLISLFRAKPMMKRFLKRRPKDTEKTDQENNLPVVKTCAMTRTMGLYIQVYTCFRIWKMKTKETIMKRKIKAEKEKARRRQSLLAR